MNGESRGIDVGTIEWHLNYKMATEGRGVEVKDGPKRMCDFADDAPHL